MGDDSRGKVPKVVALSTADTGDRATIPLACLTDELGRQTATRSLHSPKPSPRRENISKVRSLSWL